MFHALICRAALFKEQERRKGGPGICQVLLLSFTDMTTFALACPAPR